MKNIYINEIELRTSDFDCYRRLLPSAILDIFQVAAGKHADELNCGSSVLAKENLLWVLVRTKYEVISNPQLFQKVVVKTWPITPSRLGFKREYLMEDLSGNPLVKGSSDWVIINGETRRMVPTANIYPADMEYIQQTMFEEKLTKISDFEAEDDGIFIRAGFSMLDINNHVNNTKYANFAVDALEPKENEVIKTFQIDYRHEVQMGDNLNVFAGRARDLALVKGINKAGDIMFACEVKFF